MKDLVDQMEEIERQFRSGSSPEGLTDLRGYEIWEVRGKRLVIKRDVDHQSDYPDN